MQQVSPGGLVRTWIAESPSQRFRSRRSRVGPENLPSTGSQVILILQTLGTTGLGKADIVTEVGSLRRRQSAGTGGKEISSQSSSSSTGRWTLRTACARGGQIMATSSQQPPPLGRPPRVERGMLGENRTLAYNPDCRCYLVDWAGLLIFPSLHFLN